MGIGIDSAANLFKTARIRPFGGTLLTLGVQDTNLTADRVRELARQYAFANAPSNWVPEINPKPHFAKDGFITGKSLWDFLGFTEVTALDVADFEGADVLFDLNETDTPPELRDRFDFIFDGGTLEHIFHVPNALKNLHAMLRVGGLVCHQVVSSGYPDHGFYMFSPTLFHDYFLANGYRIHTHELLLQPRVSTGDPTWSLDYTPGCFGTSNHFGFSREGMAMLIAFTAEKLESSTSGKIPQQSMYEGYWKDAETKNE